MQVSHQDDVTHVMCRQAWLPHHTDSIHCLNVIACDPYAINATEAVKMVGSLVYITMAYRCGCCDGWNLIDNGSVLAVHAYVI